MVNIHMIFFKSGPVVQQEMPFKEKKLMDIRCSTQDRQRPITNAHLEPLAQVS